MAIATTDQVLPSQRMWRALVRIEIVQPSYIKVCVPAYDKRTRFVIPKETLPVDLRQHVQAGMRVHARVNIGAETKRDVNFEDWEFV